MLVIPIVDAAAYVERYAQPDKARTGLGASEDAWTVPYWWVDGGLSVQALLYAVVDAGLGALFFGQFEHERKVLDHFGVPAGLRALGTVAIGHPTPEALQRGAEGSAARRTRRPPADAIHRGVW